MGILSGILLVFFIIVSILLILLVLIQDEEGDSLGGIFAGGSASAFGSRSGNVLTRATSVLGALFLILSLGLALANRTPGVSGVENAARQQAVEIDNTWWQEAAPIDAGTSEVVPELLNSVNPEVPQETAPSDEGVSEVPQDTAE